MSEPTFTINGTAHSVPTPGDTIEIDGVTIAFDGTTTIAGDAYNFETKRPRWTATPSGMRPPNRYELRRDAVISRHR